MSRLHIVKVTGKSIPELIKGLQGAIAELQSAPTPGHSVEISSVDDDEMEEVTSPFSTEPGAVNKAPAGGIVIDNELDSEGIPWDSRIHASTKTKIGSGAWKQRKGVDKDTVNQIKAELRSRGNQTTVVHQLPASNPAPTVQVPVHQTPTPVVTNVPPSIPTVQAPPQALNGHTLDSFKNNFAVVIGNLISQGKLAQEYINSLCNHFGIQQIWMASPDQQAACFYEFVKCGVIQQVG